jgi:hypothetical protein
MNSGSRLGNGENGIFAPHILYGSAVRLFGHERDCLVFRVDTSCRLMHQKLFGRNSELRGGNNRGNADLLDNIIAWQYPDGGIDENIRG